jgi:hypothetical protein
MKYYFYKLMYDAGSAPCVTSKLLSLAICKPKIRTSARVGDWIFGFGSATRLGNRLIYIAEVTGKHGNGDYYNLQKYQRREDCIYQWNGDRLVWKPGSKFHINGSWKDIGDPPYQTANVLVSSNFRYLGSEGTTEYLQQYPSLANSLSKLTQGHRVNHGERLEKELDRLRLEMWEKYPDQMKLGMPSDTIGKNSCNSNRKVSRSTNCRIRRKNIKYYKVC